MTARNPLRVYGRSSRRSSRAGQNLLTLAAACLLLGGGSFPQTVRAQSQSVSTAPQGPLWLSAGVSYAWDDNVFRLPDAADPQALLGTSTKSDRYVSASVGVHLDKPYAQQRFRLDATASGYRYDTFSFLNSNLVQYDGAWDWHVTPRVSGTLSANRNEALVNYGDYRTPIRNIVRTQNQRFSIDGLLFGGWHLLGGVSRDETKNSVVFVQQASYRATGADAGLRYVAESGNSATVTTRSSRADYIDQPLDPANLLDDGYRRDESELRLEWMLSGKSRLNGRLTRIEYRSNHFTQRDFSGTGGSLAYQWAPTGKVSLNLSVGRDLEVYVDRFSSYAVSDTLALAPVWRISARTALRANISRVASDYRGAVVGLSGPARRDTLDSVQLAVDWFPARSVTLSASVQRDHRASNDAAFAFDDTTAHLDATLTF
jgi:exopolysaccharide biosynthesis operon protein EpsL